ncbi:MAG: T9SS type A sorting domain-containing protein, partial [Bacteroidales bacterium]|nr:T9SS type A sorting domain-containing protein [Bacteroidales bacterium]
YLIVKEIDTVEYPSGERRVFHFEPIWWTHWIEGIGNERGLLYYSGDRPFDGTYSDLICCKINDTLAFLHTDYSDCFDFNTSIPKEKEITGPGVYPNPVIDESLLDLSHTFDILEIYNYNGSMIMQSHVSGMDYYTINSSQFSPGIYLYRIISSKGKFRSGRFIIN